MAAPTGKITKIKVGTTEYAITTDTLINSAGTYSASVPDLMADAILATRE